MSETIDFDGGLDDLEFCSPPFVNKKIFGHDAIYEQFIQQFNNNTLHHAWLLSGEQGIGKASLAYFIAAKLLDCNDTILIEKRLHPNLYVVERGLTDTGTAQSNIPVESIRKLTHFLQSTAAHTGYRVVIIDSIDEFNRNSTNAFLKSLEEPPHNVIFLIICHAIGKLLPTIRSRVLVQKLSPLNDDMLKLALQSTISSLSPSELPLIIRQSRGNVRMACILAQGQGPELFAQIENEFFSNNWPNSRSFELIAKLADKNKILQWNLAKNFILMKLNKILLSNLHGTIMKLNFIAHVFYEIDKLYSDAEEYNLDKHSVMFSILEKARAVLV